MGNDQNCVKMNEKSSKPISEPVFQAPYRTRSLMNSIHYEEGNINILINAKSSFLRPNDNPPDYQDNISIDGNNHRKFSENPETFEIEIKKLLSELSSRFTGEKTEITLNLEGKYVTKQTSLDLMYFFENAKNIEKLELNLNNVYLNDEKFSTIINAFQCHTGIIDLTLKLSKNHLGYLSGKLISQLISKFIDLESLYIDLSYNPDMSGNSLEELADSFALLTQLKTLKLEVQATKLNSSDLFFLEFKESLIKMINLKGIYLDLSKNFLKPNVLSIFISGLQNMSQIEDLTLNLSYNSLRAQDLYDLSSNCSEFRDLAQFHLICHECGLSLSEYEIIYMGLARLIKLEKLYLDLGKNYNCNKVVNYLVDYINPEKSFISIQQFKLNVTFNLFQEINYENLSFLLLSMKNLRHFELFIGNNALESKGIENIICALGGMKFLRSLKIDLKNCEVKNNGFELIGSSFAHIKSLRYIYLGFQTTSCTLQNLLNFLEIINGMYIEYMTLDLGERIFHRTEINLLLEKLSSLKILKKMDFIKNSNFYNLNNLSLEQFKSHLNLKTKAIYIVFLLNKHINNRKTVKELLEKLI